MKQLKNKNEKNRKRRCIWFNQIFCQAVKTNLCRKFISIFKNNLKNNSNFNKIINKNNIKLSYFCMANIKNTIKNHNSEIIENPEKKNKKK